MPVITKDSAIQALREAVTLILDNQAPTPMMRTTDFDAAWERHKAAKDALRSALAATEHITEATATQAADETLDIEQAFALAKATDLSAVEVPPSDAARDVLAERKRQIEKEGWTPEHDDQYQDDELPLAGACYALTSGEGGSSPDMWPWPEDWWKPKDNRRNLVKAAALLLAEIERIDRASMKGNKQ